VTSLILPRWDGLTREQNAFLDNITREARALRKENDALSDLLLQTRTELGLSNEAFTNAINGITGDLNDVNGSLTSTTQVIGDRIGFIEENYSQFGWNTVRDSLPSISIPTGAYDQQMLDYAVTVPKTGWYRGNITFNTTITSGFGTLVLRIVTTQAIGWLEVVPFSVLLAASSITTNTITGKISEEYPLVASNNSNLLTSCQFIVRMAEAETIQFFLTKYGTFTQIGTVGNLANALSVTYITEY
jgi:hypothetical protein